MKNLILLSFGLLMAVAGTAQTLIPIRQEGKWGYATADDKIVIPCQFDGAEPFEGNYAYVTQISTDSNGNASFLAAVINAQGKIVLPFEKGLSWKQENEYDLTQLTAPGFLAEGIFPIYQPSPRGAGALAFMDLSGKVTTVKGLPEFTEIVGFSEGLGLAFNIMGSMKSGYVNKAGAVVIPINFKNTGFFSEGLAVAGTMECNEGDRPKIGYINKQGKMAIPCKYLSAGAFSEGLAPVSEDGDTWGFIDKTGKYVIQPAYTSLGSEEIAFKEGLARVVKDGKYGFIDKTGKTAIAFEFDDANMFSEGMAAVKKGDKWGFIDKTGKEVIACQFYDDTDTYYVFKNGLACVRQKFMGDYFFVKPDGSLLETEDLADVKPMGEVTLTAVRGFNAQGLVKIKRNGNDYYLLMDKNGKIYGE